MPALNLDHVALPMFDPVKTRAFYEGVLGLTLADAHTGAEWGGRDWLMMIFADEAGRHVSLCAFRGLESPLDRDWPLDARHYAFAAPDLRALAAWKKRLDRAGVAWREENHGDQQSIYFEDPSGTVLEITAPPTPTLTGENADAELVIRAFTEGSRA